MAIVPTQQNMELPQQFERFLQNISVDESKMGRIRSAHMNLSRTLEADQIVGPAMIETFLQGSYVHGTAIRPFGSGTEYDVDVCCLLDLTSVPSGTEEPRRLVRWLARRLRRVEAYSGRVTTRARCVRIDIPGDFHLDVVPMIEDRSLGSASFLLPYRAVSSVSLLVPDRDINGWEATNPKGLATWYGEQNRRTSGRFTRVVRMLKHWRNQVFDTDARPPSVGFEVLVANSWPFLVNSDARAVDGVLRQIATRFRHTRPSAMNPSLRNEDLLSDWSHDSHEDFVREVTIAADLADAALRETNEDRSIGLWQRLFRRRFPHRG